MELASQIRRLRNERNLSQDDLAQVTYVSRQTVSNWERDRTYPDVHSPLLLSELFDTTVDELIKGDVTRMEELLESKEPYKRMTRLVTGGTAFLLGGVALLALGLYRFGWGTVPSYIIFALMGGMGLALARQVDLMKRRYDLAAYREIVAFSKGEPIDRDEPEEGFARVHPFAMRAFYAVASAAVGLVVALLPILILR